MLTGLVAGDLFVMTVYTAIFFHDHAVSFFSRLMTVIASGAFLEVHRVWEKAVFIGPESPSPDE
jgi:hypothetical protein